MENDLKIEKESEKVSDSFEMVDINNDKKITLMPQNEKEEKVFKKEEKATSNNIPFIAKSNKEEKTDRELPKEETMIPNEESEDEIDLLINKIGKSKGKKVKIEEQAKLDFDEEMKIGNLKGESNIPIPIEPDVKANLNLVSKKENNKDIREMSFVNIKQNNKPDNTTTQITPKLYTDTLNTNTPNTNTSNPMKNPATEMMKPTSTLLQKTNQIIDPYLVNSKQKIYNSDLILCILELCINSKAYGFKYKSKSRAFWEEISKKEDFKNKVQK